MVMFVCTGKYMHTSHKIKISNSQYQNFAIVKANRMDVLDMLQCVMLHNTPLEGHDYRKHKALIHMLPTSSDETINRMTLVLSCQHCPVIPCPSASSQSF